MFRSTLKVPFPINYFRWKHNNKLYDHVRTITFMYPLERSSQRHTVCALQKHVERGLGYFKAEIQKALSPVCFDIKQIVLFS